MKAVLRNRIYLELTPEQKVRIEKELTYTIDPVMPTDPPLIIKNLRKIRGQLYSMPSGREDLIPEGHEIVDKRLTVPVEFPDLRLELRPSQQEVYDKVNESCIINALVGWGKTFTSLAIAKKLGQKTLIVTHTTNLRNQWKREVEKLFGFTPGIIGSGEFDMSTPIVVGNTQTLYKKLTEISREFGTIIVDEFHHLPAKTFNKIVDNNAAKYKIGLSGTVKRKDGKHVIFQDYFSPILHRPAKENTLTPEIIIHKSEIRFPDGAGTPWAKRVNAVAYSEEYQHLVAFLGSAMVSQGHKVLIVSDRTELLKNVAKLCGDDFICITGEVKIDEREPLEKQLYENKHGLCGSISIYKEGISINCLSCLILATPINNEPLLEQLIGRVIRNYEGKQQPAVIDIHLKGNTARRQASERMGHYIKNGYRISNI